MPYCYCKSFSFQRLRGFNWLNVEKPLRCRVGNDYIYAWKILIYAGKNNVKWTAVTSKWVIIPVTRQFIALKNVYLEYLRVAKKCCFEICLQMKQYFSLSHINGKDRHKKRWRKNLLVLKSLDLVTFNPFMHEVEKWPTIL